MTSTVAERLSAVKLIRSYGGEGGEADRFRGQADRYRQHVVRTQRFAALTSPVSELFGGLLLVVLIAVGASPGLMGGGLSPEGLLVFIVAALRVMAPLKAITQFPGRWRWRWRARSVSSRCWTCRLAEVEAGTGSTARFDREIVFEGVGFTYGTAPRRDRWTGPAKAWSCLGTPQHLLRFEEGQRRGSGGPFRSGEDHAR